MSIAPLDRGAPTFVAGHRGLVGGAVLRHFEAEGFSRLVTRTSAELDLRDTSAVEEFFAAERPATVVMAAAKVGGIHANSTYPADFISDNLRMQVNVLDAAARNGATKLLFLGSSCIYPKLAPQPIREDSLLTTSGYQANCAALVSLIAPPEDVVILDRLCHASTYDAAKLSGAPLLRFRHNDLADLQRQLQHSLGARRRLVCVESVYSMDGDEAPLRAIDELCTQHGALLLVDEAHALGVLGPGGRGLCAEQGVTPDLLVGTCSKSLGSQGGFLVGDSALVELCVNKGRSFIFSTAPVPAAVGAATAMLDVLRDQPELPEQLLVATTAVRAALTAQGWAVPAGRTPIIPVVVGDEAAALALSAKLREAGHFAPAIRPPTVPPGECRLRLTVTLAHSEADRRKLVKALAVCRDG